MAVVTMQKVAVLAPKSLRETLLDSLQKEGVLHVSDVSSDTVGDHTEVAFKKAELEYAITALTAVAAKEVIAEAGKASSPEAILKAASGTDIRGIVDELKSLEVEDTESARKRDELLVRRRELARWAGYVRSFHGENESGFARQVFGTAPEQNVNVMLEKVSSAVPRCSVESFDSSEGSRLLCATVWKADEELFEEIVTTHGWTTVIPPHVTGTATEEIHAIDAALSTSDAARAKRAARRVTLSAKLPELTRTRTFMTWLDDKGRVREAAMTTNATVMLSGWMPKSDAEALQKKLTGISASILVLRIKPEEGEEAPVLLRNARGVSPFESVTTLYGLPLYEEMDPTAMLSPFFGLFFALCLTDAGYGLSLMLIFGIWLLVTKKSISEAKLPWLLFISGILAFLVGIPFGGWFGLSSAALPDALSFLTKETSEGIRFRGQIWDLSTQSGIGFLQNLSLVLGLAHMFFGMFLAGYHKWVHGNRAQAFWENFTSHILFAAVLFVAFTPTEWKHAATYALYASIALIVWGKGYGSPWYLRPVFGVLGVVNMGIGLLSNGLSYLRILALGLVTGAMALAVNQVAGEMSKLFPIWLGIPVMILIAVMGHTISIALNTLGSFIHASRLQFIEFFSQFFEGGGKPFAPFKRSTSS